MRVRDMTPADWPAVAAIYAEGLATGDATFETQVPAWEDWDAARVPSCRLVAVGDGPHGEQVTAWAALSAVSKRPVYAGVAEVSLYVGAAHRGQGAGSALLSALIEASETAGFWTLQAGIFPENRASLAVFGRAGFREVGVRHRLGQRDGHWRDVVLLERRSLTR